MAQKSAKNPMRVQEMVRRRVRRRQMVRRTRLASLVVGAAIAVSAAAFGIDRMVVALTRYYSSPSSHAVARPTATSTPATTVASGPPGCVSGQLTGTVANWQAAAGTTYEIVSLTNISPSTCTLDGYPVLGANAENGTALPAPARDDAQLGQSPGTSSPGPSPVPVASGATSWFELSFPDVCSQVLNPGAPPGAQTGACFAGNLLQVTPPKTTSSLLVTQPLRFSYGTAGFDVGPFEGGTTPSSPPLSQ